jgi:hypothetical protein
MIAFAWIIFFSFSVMSFSLLPKIKSKIISINNIILKEKMNEADTEKGSDLE